MFNTILVPLDGSSFAGQALPWALAIARRANASLNLVRGHVRYALKEPASRCGPFAPVEEAGCKRQEQTYLDATARWLASVSPVRTTTALIPGGVAAVNPDDLVEHVRSRGADLIVMATHGRGPVSRFFLGSVADELIRRSAAPVLLVQPREPAPSLLPGPTVGRVLVPLDGSALAEQALGPAADLARLFEAECTLLRVVPPTAVLPHSGAAHPALASSGEAEAREYLARLAERLRAEGLRARARLVVSRHAEEAILEEARSSGSGLIALATHGRGGVSRMVLGSVADKVIRGSAVPVLVQRHAST
jgi:nucleotide-binding universal stress UspA family protein